MRCRVGKRREGGEGKNRMARYPFIERPVDPTRKRFYLVDVDWRRSVGDMELLNEGEIIKLGSASGHHEEFVFAGTDSGGRDQYYGSSHYGLPKIFAKPQIKVGIRNKPLDFYRRSGRIFVSARAKALLASIDPDAFDFAECDTVTRHRVRLEPYWMMAVKRVVTEFDEEHSVFREIGGRDPTPVPSNLAMGISHIYDIRMSPEMPDDYHAFYLIKYLSYFIFDEVIVDAWRAAKFNSLIFSPLQPPTKKELSTEGTVSLFLNWKFFVEQFRHEWEDLI